METTAQTRKKFMPQVVSAGHVAAGCERRFCLCFRGDESGAWIGSLQSKE